MKHIVPYVLSLCLAQPSFAKVTYSDIPPGESPFPKSNPTPDYSASKELSDLYNNSGLYKNPPKVYVPGSNAATGGGNTLPNTGTDASTGISQPQGALPDAPKTYYDSQGFEVDVESGVLTGNHDPSKATGRTPTPPESRDSMAPENSPAEAETASSADTEKYSNTPPAKSTAENTPDGYTAEAQTLTTTVSAIHQLTVTAGSQNAVFKPLGLAELEAGAKAYSASQVSCIKSQASASTWCRDDTNPELQTTLMLINGATAAMNSVAVKDACSTISKVMTLAQLGMTAYTVSCGAMKFKCDLTCGKAAKGLTAIQAGLAKPYTCVPVVVGQPHGCAALGASYAAHAKKIIAILQKEMVPEDKKAIAGKAKLCSATYAGLLASAGISLLSIANSIKGSRQCEKDTDGASDGGGAGESSSQGIAQADSTTSADTSVPAKTSDSSASGNNTAAPLAATSGEAQNQVRVTEVKKMSDSPYAAYLPGGSKDPNRDLASEAAWRKEVTGAGGKSNWQKARERYRDFDALP